MSNLYLSFSREINKVKLENINDQKRLFPNTNRNKSSMHVILCYSRKSMFTFEEKKRNKVDALDNWREKMLFLMTNFDMPH